MTFTKTAFAKIPCSKMALTTDVKRFSCQSQPTLPFPVSPFVCRVPSQADKVEAMSQGGHVWLLCAAL